MSALCLSYFISLSVSYLMSAEALKPESEAPLPESLHCTRAMRSAQRVCRGKGMRAVLEVRRWER